MRKLHPAVTAYMAAIGQKGGAARTMKKKTAVRKNGKLGGRPRKALTAG